MLEYASLSEI